MADLSRLSNADLRAITEGDMSSVSDYGLKVIAGEDQQEKPRQTQESSWYSPERLAANPLTTFAVGAAKPILGAMELIPGDIGRSWAARNKEMERLAELGREQQTPALAAASKTLDIGGQIASPVFTKLVRELPTAKTNLQLLGQGVGIGGVAGFTAPTGTSVSEDAIGKLEQGGTGAALGAALPIAGSAIKGGYNIAAPLLSRKAAESGAAKQVIEIAGNEALDVANRLTQGQPINQSQIETAGQILSEMNSPKISALQKYWQGKFGSTEAYRNELAQKDLEVARIKLLGAETQPQRQAAIAEANRITQAFRIASSKGTEYRDEAAKLVSKARDIEQVKLTQSAAEREIIRNSTFQPNVPGVVGGKVAKAQEIIGRANRMQENLAQQSLRAGASARLAENIVGTMSQRGLKPLSVENFISSIKSTSELPQNVVNDSLRLLSNRVINAANRAGKANNGVLDAASLDALRRTAINDFIASASRGNPAQAKQLAANEATVSFKKLIDNAIENAGGKGYSDYMRSYSSAREQIEAPLLRMEKSDEMAKAGMQDLSRIMNEHNIHGLGVLERTVTIAQALIRATKGIAGKKVGESGAKLMTNDPTKLGMLIKEQIEKPKGMLGDITRYHGGVTSEITQGQ